MLRRFSLFALCAGLVALVACDSGAEGQIHFPTHQYPPLTNWGTDYIFGELMLVNGCLRLSYMDPSRKENTTEGVLVVWPAGFRLNRNTTPAQVINTTGLIAARIGDNARISGAWSEDPRPAWMPPPPTRTGIVPYEVPDTATLAKELPEECPGPYWIVGDEVSALGPDEPLEISPPYSTLYFPRSKTRLGPYMHFDALLEGQLVLDGDCLRLQNEHGHIPYEVVIWPPGFAPHLENEEVQIRNGGQRTIARVGDKLGLGGAGGGAGSNGRCSDSTWETSSVTVLSDGRSD